MIRRLSTLLLLTACLRAPAQSATTYAIYSVHADTVVTALHHIQKKSNHLWHRAGWWNSANIFEATLDYEQRTGHRDTAACRRIFNRNKLAALGGFKNYAFDDNGWWALSWLKAYDLYGDKKYLTTAENIFADMIVHGYDDVCGGGMVWNRVKRYKNAVTNELFIVLAARLSRHQSDTARKAYYLTWALRDYHWLLHSGMINPDYLVNDGLDGATCQNNKANCWIYNQGIILGGLKELYLVSSDTTYLHLGRQIAYSTLSHLSDSKGVLTEHCTGDCNEDQVQFKGIFMRYLADLNTVLQDSGISAYIRYNADNAWVHAQNKDHLFDYRWQGAYKKWTGSSTGSALDLMNAASQQ